jgi:uncharacterized Fe-S radical SAM superfamily protein PflX
MDIHIYINNNKKAGTLVRRGAYPLPGAANGVEQSVTHLNAAQGKVARKEEARDARTAAASLFFFFDLFAFFFFLHPCTLCDRRCAVTNPAVVGLCCCVAHPF